jgi:hypothetical protein
MREICEECTRICCMIPKDTISTHVSKEDYQRQWKGHRELTSLSILGKHFGHYIAGTQSDHISHFHALKATLIMKQGIVLDWWAWGLSVMLEIMFGRALITKLWSILLMEADFNTTNKMIYGQRMLDMARHYKLVPEEIYSEWNCLANDGTLAKVLFYDIVRQTRLPAGISGLMLTIVTIGLHTLSHPWFFKRWGSQSRPSSRCCQPFKILNSSCKQGMETPKTTLA